MFQWQKWMCPEWCHLLVVALAVRLARTLNIHILIIIAGAVICSIGYELVVYWLTGHKVSYTDLIADALGLIAGFLI